MKTKLFLALTICCSSALFAGDSVYYELSRKFLKTAVDSNIKTLAVFPPANKDALSAKEIDYISEKICSNLDLSKKIKIIEPETVTRLLSEKSLIYANLSPKEKVERAAVELGFDGAVIASVYTWEGKMKVFAKLVDVRKEKAVALYEGEEDRNWEFRADDTLARDDIKLKLSEVYVKPAEYRDAVSDFNSDPCSAATAELKTVQKDTVALKAKFWAAKMKEPGFSYRSLTRNPGSELKDPAVKQEFYNLLRNYYESGNKVSFTNHEVNKIREILNREKQLSDRCGI